MLTVRDIANDLNVTERTIHRYIRCGQIKATKIGRKLVIDEKEYQAFLLKGTQEDYLKTATKTYKKSIAFIDLIHRKHYKELLQKFSDASAEDNKVKALCYLLTLTENTRKQITKVFDVGTCTLYLEKINTIKDKQTKTALLLAYNLYTGELPSNSTELLNPLNLFADEELYKYFYYSTCIAYGRMYGV